jgi:hypothetical protein
VFGGNSREELRRAYRDAWDTDRLGRPLTALQAQIVAVIREHPEYHVWLEREQHLLEDFGPERGISNPFLHLGMHLALRDQVATDRPAGVRAAAQKLIARHQDRHAAEHAMMEPLAAALWEAQRAGVMPDETRYLQAVLRLARSKRTGPS